jgi:hypothetical protein
MTMIRRSLAAAIVAVLVCSAAPGAGGQDRSAYRATELIQRWRIIINTTFEERRAAAEEPVMDSIEIVISPGAVKATQDAANEQRLKTIDAAVERFALAMVAAGEHSPDGSVVITETAIDAGLKKVCPVYPFC